METLTWVAVAIVVAAAMEPWSRVVHHHVWHGPLYGTHRSHHEPTGFFEANDLFALAHAFPAATMIIWGCGDHGLAGTLAFGVGVGMTLFGASYGLVHDGYIHGRLPLGFLDRFRWLRRIKSAHRAHHVTGEVPYGLFLGPRELAAHSRAVRERREAERSTRRSEVEPRAAVG